MANRLYYTPAQQNYKEASMPDNISRMISLVEPMRRQAMYDEARLDTMVEKFGQFTSPLPNDVNDYYGMIKRSGMSQLVNDIANNPSMYGTPEFNQRLAQVKSGIDYNLISNLEQSKAAALGELKRYDNYNMKGVGNPMIHQINYNHRTSDRTQGIYKDQMVAPWISVDDYMGQYFKNVGVGPERKLVDAGGGYYMAVSDNSAGLDSTADRALVMADPAVVRNWELEYNARTNAGEKLGDFNSYIQDKINEAKDPFRKYDSEELKDPYATSRYSGSRSGLPDGDKLSSFSDLIPLHEVKMIGSSQAERFALNKNALAPIDNSTLSQVNEILSGDGRAPLVSTVERPVTIKDAMNALGEVADTDMQLLYDLYKIDGDAPVVERESDINPELSALAENMMDGFLGKIANVNPDDTDVTLTLDKWATDLNVKVDGKIPNPTIITFDGSDDKGNSSEEYYYGKPLKSEVTLSNADGEEVEFNDDALIRRMHGGLDKIVSTEKKERAIPYDTYLASIGSPQAKSSFVEGISEEEREEGLKSGKYKYSDQEFIDEWNRFKEDNPNESLGSKYLNHLRDKIFSGRIPMTEALAQRNRNDENNFNSPYLHGMSTFASKERIENITKQFGQALITSGQERIGKLILKDPDKLISVFFQDKDGSVATDKDSGAPITTIGKMVSIEKDESGEKTEKGLTNQKGYGGDYYTINFNYSLPLHKNAEQNYLSNKDGFLAAGTDAQNAQQVSIARSLSGLNASAIRERIQNQIINELMSEEEE